MGTHAAALAYQLFLSTLALSRAGLALMGLAEDVLPFDLPEGTEEQFANLTGGASATLGIVSFVVLLWTASALARRASNALRAVFRTGREGAVRGGLLRRGDHARPRRGDRGPAGPDRRHHGDPGRGRARGAVPDPRAGGDRGAEFGLFLLAYTVLTPEGWAGGRTFRERSS